MRPFPCKWGHEIAKRRSFDMDHVRFLGWRLKPLKPGILRISEPTEWKMNPKSSNCRGWIWSSAHLQFIELEFWSLQKHLKWYQIRPNFLGTKHRKFSKILNFCLGVRVGGHFLTDLYFLVIWPLLTLDMTLLRVINEVFYKIKRWMCSDWTLIEDVIKSFKVWVPEPVKL